MARTHTWLPRLPEIIKSVEGSVRTHYDRKDIERLFELQPRAAQTLQILLPSVKIGQSRLVERESLLTFLNRLREAGNTTEVVAQVRNEKALLSKRKPRNLVPRDTPRVFLDSLPDRIRLSRGRLDIQFDSTAQMAELLYQIALLLEMDGDAFAARFDPLPESEEPGYSDEMQEARWIRSEIDRLEAEANENKLVV
jgi:hypothetical protein